MREDAPTNDKDGINDMNSDMKEKRSFYSDASHNYMVLACPPDIREDYQYKMIAANEIGGLLPCSSRSIDNREYLYYDITSKQSLSDLYDRRPVRGEDLQRLLGDLVQVGNCLTEYLLDASHVVLDPSCIYVDYREQNCSFAYYPGEAQEDGWETLFAFLADRVDGRDKRAAAVAYRLCMMAEKPGFRLKEEVLEELGLPVPGPKERGSGFRQPFEGPAAGGFPPDPLCPVRDGRSDGPCGMQGYGSCGEGGRGPYPGYAGSVQSAGGGEMEASAGRSRGGDRTKERGQEWENERIRERDQGWQREAAWEERFGSVPAVEEGPGGNFRNIWPAAGAVLLLGGAGLFFLDLIYVLGETEELISKALGGVLVVSGLGILLWQAVRAAAGRGKEKEKGEEPFRGDPGAEGMPAFHKEDAFEQPSSPLADAGGRFPAPEGGGAPYWSPPSGMGAPAEAAGFPAGDTSLLAPGDGGPTGLYGTAGCRGEQISLAHLPCVVGKMREYVDQVLSDDTVSRMHARFSVDREGEMTVRDLNSTNGTWINGERLSPNESRPIRQGDHIRLGRMEFVYR